MAGSTFRLTGDLMARLNRLDDKIKRGMVASAHYVAPQAEAYMRDNASWTDRTGNARQGLRASVFADDNKVAIVLYHSVYYGVFLELRWGGKYAIIEPTMQYTGQQFVQALSHILA